MWTQLRIGSYCFTCLNCYVVNNEIRQNANDPMDRLYSRYLGHSIIVSTVPVSFACSLHLWIMAPLNEGPYGRMLQSISVPVRVTRSKRGVLWQSSGRAFERRLRYNALHCACHDERPASNDDTAVKTADSGSSWGFPNGHPNVVMPHVSLSRNDTSCNHD